MDELFENLSGMPPEDALTEITEILNRLLEDIHSHATARLPGLQRNHPA
ncbi:MAG: hypothetical protein ACLFUY_03330 [Desulfobacterales bacterium]